MIYRLAKETDIDKICSLVESAVRKMEIQQFFNGITYIQPRLIFLMTFKSNSFL